MGFSVRIVEEAAELEALASDWARLSAVAPSASPFNDRSWIQAWWTAFAEPGDRLRLLVLEHDGQVAALAPLMIRPEPLAPMARPLLARTGALQRVLAPLARAAELPWRPLAGARAARSVFNYYLERTDFLFDPAVPGALPALLEAIAADRGAWDALELPWVPTDSALFHDLAGGRPESLHAYAVETGRSPFVRLSGRSYREFYEARVSVRSKRQDRYTLRQAEKLGGFTMERIDAGPRLERAIDDMLAIDQRGWKGGAHSSMQADLRVQRFVREVCAAAADKAQLSLWMLNLEGTPAAFSLAFVYGQTYYAYRTSFDGRHEALSPGRMIVNRALEDAFGLGLERFDFLGAATVHKLRYTDEARPHATVFLYHQGLRSRVRRSLKRSVIPLANELLERGARYPVLFDR